MESKIINLSSDNYFFRSYETISYDETNCKKPFVCTELIKRTGKMVAKTFNVSSKQMMEILKEIPGIFFSLPKEVYEQYFSKTVLDNVIGEKTDLELFLEAVKEGMISAVEKIEGKLDEIDKNVEEFQAKILEKVDFEKENYKSRIEAKKKIAEISLNA